MLLLILAVFFVWESVYAAVPWTIPAWLQPLLVYAAALALAWPDWRLALAVGGGVGLLHVLIRAQASPASPVAPQVLRRKRSNVPDLP